MKIVVIVAVFGALFTAEALRALLRHSSATSTAHLRLNFKGLVTPGAISSSDKIKSSLKAHETDGLVETWKDELVSLQGTPELVDRLENLVAQHPGIENNINLYRAIYPFVLDDFQEEGLQLSLIHI